MPRQSLVVRWQHATLGRQRIDLFTMQIQITGHRIDVTQAMQDYVNEKAQKLDKLLTHLDADLRQANVTVRHLDGPRIGVNFDMTLPGKRHIFHDETREDFYAAVDALIDVVESEIRRSEEKHHEPHPEDTPTFRG